MLREKKRKVLAPDFKPFGRKIANEIFLRFTVSITIMDRRDTFDSLDVLLICFNWWQSLKEYDFLLVKMEQNFYYSN